MLEKVIEIVGISEEGFAEGAKDAIVNAAKTVKEIRWELPKELEVRVENGEISEYLAYR